MKKIREFMQLNGWYLLVEEISTRMSISLRGQILGHKLRTERFRVGPNSFIRGLECMKVGIGFEAGAELWLEAITRYKEQVFTPRIVIGDGVHVSRGVHIAATNYVEIGDHCLFGSKVTITDHNHGQYANSHSSPHEPPVSRLLDCDRRVMIGRNVWLGDSVVVGPGSVIGEGCVVGANSMVRGTLPSFSISSGNPAKVFKTFSFERQEWIDSK
jgi:acetyltransferase-like isoleucine patch superfamily enzyme